MARRRPMYKDVVIKYLNGQQLGTRWREEDHCRCHHKTFVQDITGSQDSGKKTNIDVVIALLNRIQQGVKMARRRPI
jgi:hypothetical protein